MLNCKRKSPLFFIFFCWIVSALYLSLWVWDEDIFYSKLLICGEELVCNYKGMCVVENWVMIIRKNYDKIYIFFILEKLKKKANDKLMNNNK